MAVGTAYSGVQRWRSLEAASRLLCPLHEHPLRHRVRHCASNLPIQRSHWSSKRNHTHSPSHVPAASAAGSTRFRGSQIRHDSAVAADGAAGRSLTVVAAAIAAALLAAVAAAAAAYPATAASATASAAAAAAVAAAGSGLPPAFVCFVSLLPSLGSFVLCVAAAAFLLAAVPALAALARTAAAAERLLAAAEAELPDTVAAMRLTGLEVSDCISELGALGGELTRGVRSTAALATAAEAGLRGGAVAADAAIKNHVIPAAARAERDARGAAEAHLAATAALPHSPAAVLGQAAAATADTARRLRAGLAIGRLATTVVRVRR